MPTPPPTLRATSPASRRRTGVALVGLAVASCSPPPLTRDAAMVDILGARVQIGDDAAPRDERPQFTADIAAFRMDRSPVTVAQFAAFIAKTSYVSEAEKFGGAGVLSKGDGAWLMVEGADWKHPRGPEKSAAEDDHPVTQVSWNDAVAYCAAHGARLPTEFEWERAAQMGQTPDGTVFRSGTAASFDAKFRLNAWQGVFPVMDTGEDGYLGTSPVGAFGAAPSGLTDMAGNVWEWTSSAYLPYPVAPGDTRTINERVQRGGSFLCSDGVCEGFRATARAHATPDSSLMHLGFRCAADRGAG